MPNPVFGPKTFAYLRDLAANNDRAWFDAHLADYEAQVREPALAFIEAMAVELPFISTHFTAIPRKVGGSLMRVYRDTRFARDKTPYKTNVGIQFRHEAGKDVHAPGYYVHLAADECFVGVGLWRPDAPALGRIRDLIVETPEAWIAARDNPEFRKHFALGGESLSNAPRGYPKDHPLLSDLRRKDFIAMSIFTQTQATGNKLQPLVLERMRAATPLMRFLCKAVELPF